MIKPPARANSAFTLIELLAVIIIISLVAGVSSVGLVAGSRQANILAAASDLKNLDAHARIAALTSGTMDLTLKSELDVATLQTREGRVELARVTLPVDCRIELLIDKQPRTVVDFDALGRSADYNLEIGLEEHRIFWAVCGLTGWIVESEASP